MVVARNEKAQLNLIKQLQNKAVKREYRAIVWGQIWKNGTIDEPIGRHPTNRVRMAVNRIHGKESVTHYEVLERFGQHTYLRCNLETGRTHQIRVHMSFIKSPIVGDPAYGMKKIIPLKHLSDEFNPDIPSDENWQISNFYDNIKECDIIIICVPTPVNSSFEPDLSMVHNAFEEISKNTSETEDLTLILESTVQPGTTNNCFSMFFDNIDDTKNFNIAYCPERISPGDSFYVGHNVDRISGYNNITLKKILTKLIILLLHHPRFPTTLE